MYSENALPPGWHPFSELPAPGRKREFMLENEWGHRYRSCEIRPTEKTLMIENGQFRSVDGGLTAVAWRYA